MRMRACGSTAPIAATAAATLLASVAAMPAARAASAVSVAVRVAVSPGIETAERLRASGASGLLVWTLRELSASNRRFNDFVNEISRLNHFFSERD